jgi:hypothetical protein
MSINNNVSSSEDAILRSETHGVLNQNPLRLGTRAMRHALLKLLPFNSLQACVTCAIACAITHAIDERKSVAIVRLAEVRGQACWGKGVNHKGSHYAGGSSGVV